MKHSIKFFTFTVSLLTAAVADAKNKKCTLDCNSRGTCEFGPSQNVDPNSPEMPWHKFTEENGMHCDCDKGYVGLKCGIEEVLCGDEHEPDHVLWHRCHHGSTCKEVLPGDDVYHCDCTTAFSGEKRTAGKYCEYVETTKCDDEVFCVNQGKCVNKGSKKSPNYKCKCPSDFEGPRCEYKKDEAPSCDLKCQNNGSCAVGMKDYPSFLADAMYADMEEKDLKFQHCICPKGWTGLLCEVPVVECKTDYGKFCYNGGQCVEGEDGKNFCDCTSAVNSDTSFAGLLCSERSTTFCDVIEGRDETQEFCTNGGQCPDEKHKDCKCPDDREGPRCEYEKGTMPKCSLYCKNDGQCRIGSKTVEWADMLSLNDLKSTTHTKGMHCSCPSGFAGDYCELEYETCHTKNDKNPHICQHGGTCKAEGTDFMGNVVYGCDCSTSKQSVAGTFCEHIAEEFCVRGETSGTSHSFCTNGGRCRKEIDPHEEHAGCNCPDDFEGPHCEIAKTAATLGAPTSDGGKERRKKAKVIVGVVLLTLSLVVIGVLAGYSKFKSRRNGKEPIVDINTNLHTIGTNEMTTPRVQMIENGHFVDRDLGDGEMENVEII